MDQEAPSPNHHNQLDRRALIAGLAAGATLFASKAKAGPLAPPPGPIGPTGRTVQEIYDKIARTDAGLAEPRIPVQSLPGSATVLHVISQPGSYYLTADITGDSGKDGIEIAADHVTLDLCGFSFFGGVGTLTAIRATGGRRGVQVQNGSIFGWEQDAISLLDVIGPVVRDMRIHGEVPGVGQGGVGVAVGSDAWISDVVVRRKGTGFVTENGGILRSCSAIRCEGGFFLRRAHVVDCLALGNNSTGFYVEQAGLLDRCEARENNGDGIQAHGHVGTLIRNCNCISNSANGVRVLFGLDVYVLECNLSRNAGAGVQVDAAHEVRIDGNNLTNNTVGIQLLAGSLGCVAIRNTMSANGVAFTNAGANAHGPLVNVAGVGDIASVPGADHPWANFIY